MDSNTAQAQEPAAGEVSVIGVGIAVFGNIEASVDLQIQGKVEGDVRCGTLLLGESGEIRGNVAAERVRVAGTIDGSVDTTDLAVEASARVNGDLSYTRIRIANGAVVHGKLTHVEREISVEAGGLRLVEPARAAAPEQGQKKPIYIE
jgi:cytoskeletal protein CcmA (bactofilin family)